MSSYLMLACENLRSEIMAFTSEYGAGFPIIFIPQDLHNSPDKLRVYLQDAIDSMANVDYLLLPMGMCGNGTLGLKSDNMNIVLPDCDDCIDLMLSNDEQTHKRDTYSFYLTKSWLEGTQSVNNEMKRALDKYGEKRGTRIMKMMYNNYRRMTFLDTGTYDPQAALPEVNDFAELTGLDVSVKPAGCYTLRKMLRLELEEGFVVIPKGETVAREHFAHMYSPAAE